MTIFLLILAILLVGGTALLASGRALPVGSGRFPAAGDGMAPPVASLPPVLLPEDPRGSDVDALRFGLGLRGYRMDQVDEVLDRLADALNERDAVIAELRSESATGAAHGTGRT